MYTPTDKKVSRGHKARDSHESLGRSRSQRSHGTRLLRNLLLGAALLSAGSGILLKLDPARWLIASSGVAAAALVALGATALLLLQLVARLILRLGRWMAWLVATMCALPIALLSLTVARFVALLYLPVFLLLWVFRRDRDRLPPPRDDVRKPLRFVHREPAE